MAAYRRVYDSRHLQADCQEPGSVRSAIEYGLPLPFFVERRDAIGTLRVRVPVEHCAVFVAAAMQPYATITLATCCFC